MSSQEGSEDESVTVGGPLARTATVRMLDRCLPQGTFWGARCVRKPSDQTCRPQTPMAVLGRSV